MRFEIYQQAEDIVYDDANGNTVELKRGYCFSIVDRAGTALATSDLRFPRKASVRKVIRDIIDGCGGPSGSHADTIIVDRTEENK